MAHEEDRHGRDGARRRGGLLAKSGELVGSVGSMTPLGDAVRAWLAILAASTVYFLVPLDVGSGISMLTFYLAFYDVLCVVWLGLIWLSLRSSTPSQTRRWALAQDRSGTVTQRIMRTFYGTRIFGGRTGLFTIIVVVFIGLFSALTLLPDLGTVRSTLSVVGVVVAWGLLHTSFALYYAYLYYGDEGNPGGLLFPRGVEPDALDFAYYAFGVGTTFSSPEVEVTSRVLRRTTLAHGVFSFFYNTAILALVINLLLLGVD